MSLKNERKYGIDVLRILSMLAIVGLHLLNAGGAVIDEAGISLTQGSLRLLLTVCYSSVNIFAMITGYLYVNKKKVKAENMLTLVLTCAFYCIVATVLFFVFKREVFSDKIMLIYSLFPPFAGKYWYLVCYFLVFLMIPALNRFIYAMNKKEYRLLLCVLFVTLSVVSTVGLRDYFKINTGYSPFWLMFCYLIGAYLKLYSDEERTKRRRLFYVGIIIANVLTVMAFWMFTEMVFKNPLGFETVAGYVSPLTVCNAALAVLIFSSLEIKREGIRRIVKSLSGGAFDVYIIHCQILVMEAFINGRFAFMAKLPFPAAVGIFLFSGIMIYLLCYEIYLIRSLIFRLTFLQRFSAFLGGKLDFVLPLNKTDE